MRILSESAKSVKCADVGVEARVMYLPPARSGGLGVEVRAGLVGAGLGAASWPVGGNLCLNASRGCLGSCLYRSGRLGKGAADRAARERLRLWATDPGGFWAQLGAELAGLRAAAGRLGRVAGVRLNGTSDIPWERDGEFLELHGTGGVWWYDYTKSAARMWEFLRGERASGEPWPERYHLTFSRSETNEADAWELLQAGAVVSIVCSEERKAAWLRDGDALQFDFPLVDGDEHDATFLHEGGTRLLLRAKGRALRDATGFVVREDGDGYGVEPADSVGLRRIGRPRLWPAGWVVVMVRVPVDVVSWWRRHAAEASTAGRRVTSAACMSAALVRAARGAGMDGGAIDPPAGEPDGQAESVWCWWDAERLLWRWERRSEHGAEVEAGELSLRDPAATDAAVVAAVSGEVLGDRLVAVVVRRGVYRA